MLQSGICFFQVLVAELSVPEAELVIRSFREDFLKELNQAGLVWVGLGCAGLRWVGFSLVGFGLVWFGLVGLGWVWFGLV